MKRFFTDLGVEVALLGVDCVPGGNLTKDKSIQKTNPYQLFAFLRTIQMTEIATQIPLTALLPMLAAISDRDYPRFKELEIDFASTHGVEVWEDVFNFRLKPALDKDSDRWLLIQKCSLGFTVKDIAY